MAAAIEAIARMDVPVMGHVGLTPQSVHRMGGHKVQGRRQGHAPGSRARVVDDARAVESAGAFAVVLEGIPLDLAAEITAELALPPIGIGAGVFCDGQVLVLHDLLGLSARAPKFAKAYSALAEEVTRAAEDYVHEGKSGPSPPDTPSFHSLKSVAANA